MDLGDYLYLIIFLGVALFQIVSRSLGKKETKAQDIHENKPVQPKTKRKLNREVYTLDSAQQDKSTVNEYVNPEFSTFMPTSSFLHNQEEHIDEMKREKCENTSLFSNLSDTNELKKAVIYSEIFRRKF